MQVDVSLYSSFLEQAPFGFMLLEPLYENEVVTDARFLSCNRSMLDIFGKSPDTDLTGQRFRAMIPAIDDKAKVDFFGLCTQVLRDKKISKSTEYSRYTHRWLKTDIVPIDNGTLAVSIYDVTDQYGELSEARDMLARTGRIARVGGWEKDLVNNRDYWSEVTREIHEVPPDFDANSVPRFHFYDRGENHAALVQAVNHSYATGEPFDVQTRIITARGNKRWVRVLGYPTLKDGKPVYVHGIFQDITEQKEQQLLLERNGAFQQLIAETSASLINVTNENFDAKVDSILQRFGRFFNADRSYLFRYNEDCTVATNTHEWVEDGIEPQIHNLQDLSAEYIPWWTSKLTQNYPVFFHDIDTMPAEASMEYQILKEQDIKSILVVPIFLRGITLGFFGFDAVRDYRTWFEDDISKLRLVATMLSDAIDKVRIDRELIEAKDRAVAASKAKSQFLANMSHEIRTPLNGVIGYTELLFDTTLNERQYRYLETVKISAQSLLNIVNDILDFSKIEAGKLDLDPVPADVHELADKALLMFKYQASRKQLDLVLDVDETTDFNVVVDPHRLNQVILNLVSNAVKFTDEGSVTLALKLDELPSGMGRLRVSVHDTGIGIAPQARENLFKAFSQADGSTTRRFGGTGLGLVISNLLVGKMGGEIGIRSEPGKGSEFFFSIDVPLVRGHRHSVHKKDMVKTRTGSTGLSFIPSPTILIAEDIPLNANLIRLVLNKLIPDAHILMAENGKIAVDIAMNNPVDVILMDVHMPEMDGLEATRTLRSRNHDAVIIALTAGVVAEDKERCMDAGMDDFLAKPVQQDVVAKMLYKYIGA